MANQKETGANSRTFKSADGSTRCLGCHLHADECTCRSDHPMWRVIECPIPQIGSAFSSDDEGRSP